MKKLIFLTPLFLLSSSAYAEGVVSFTFVTPIQVVLPSTLSKDITLQAQNADGKPEALVETFDVTFNSTSGTGQFFGSTGKAVSKTMSKSTSNKNFYYKDSSVGDFVISVTAVGRESKKSFKTSQHIFIGQNTNTDVVETPQKITKATTPKVVSKKKAKNEIQVVSEVVTPATQPTSTVEIFQAPEKVGFVSRVFSWPIKALGFIRHLFFAD